MNTTRVRFAVVILGAAALACNLGRPAPAPTEVSVPATASATPRAPATATSPPPTERPASPTPTQPAPTATATSAATLPPGVSATPPPLPDQPLSANGPWLLAWGVNDAYAVNPDGSGLTQVLAGWPYLRPGPAAASGGLVAFVASDDPKGERGLTLYTLEVGSGTVTPVTRLTNDLTEPGPDAQPGDEAYQIAFVLGQSAWSPAGAPGGPSLAFIGAQDGPSADLYLYTPGANRIDRLTDGPSHAYHPSWSPDGQYIVQMGAASFGTGAGYAMAGAWAARADNTQVVSLYTPDSGDEIVLGWIGPATFVVESFYARCSVGQLRAFNINTLQAAPIFPAYYSGAALDPASGTALVAVDDFVAQCNALEGGATPGAEPGIYLARPGAAPQRVAEAEADAVTWLPGAALFVAQRRDGADVSSVQGFTVQGQPAALPEGMASYWEIATAARAGGIDWAWPVPDRGGLMASLDGQPTFTVTDGPAYLPTWSPNGHTLFFYGGEALYAAERPGLAPVAVAGPDQLQGKLEYTWVP
jgi:hypothetical protein